MKWQLCFYYGGTAVLTDSDGMIVWSSPDDEEFEEEFGDLADPEDADDILEFLEESGYLPEGEDAEIVESDGGAPTDNDDEDEEDEDEEDESY